MANKPMKSLQLPGLDDTYTFLQDDETLTQEGMAADAKITGDKIGKINNTIDQITSICNYYDPKATYTQTNKEGLARSGYTINADGSISLTRALYQYGQVFLVDTNKTLTPGKYIISGKMTLTGEAPESIVLYTAIGRSVELRATPMTTTREGSRQIRTGEKVGWFKNEFELTEEEPFAFECIPGYVSMVDASHPCTIEYLMIVKADILPEYTPSTSTVEDKVARIEIAAQQTQIDGKASASALADLAVSNGIENHFDQKLYNGYWSGSKVLTGYNNDVCNENLIPCPANATIRIIADTSVSDPKYYISYFNDESTRLLRDTGTGTSYSGVSPEGTKHLCFTFEKSGLTKDDFSGVTVFINNSIDVLNLRVSDIERRINKEPVVFAFADTSNVSRQFRYEFHKGLFYTISNDTSNTQISFQTRETKNGSAVQNLDYVTAGTPKTFECTADAHWFNSWCPQPGSISILELSDDPSPSDALKAADIFNAEPYTGDYDWQTPAVEYGALFKSKNHVESFAFFTDPHVLGFGDSDRNETKMHNYLKRVQTAYNQTPCSYIVSCGDWLNNATTMDEACYRLGQLKGIAEHMFGGLKIVLGNHDTNYQGKATPESENWTGRLTDETIAAIMYRDSETKKAYFSFEGDYATCYVLDSGTETGHSTMLAYDWEQLAWLAGKLSQDDPEHAIIFLHIIVSSDAVQTFAATFGQLVEAYNAHTTITLNGQTYDFTGCSGRVDLWVAGHTHADSNGLLGGVPYVISTTNAYSSDVPIIDLALIDYDNSMLYLKRVGGKGTDRTISLTTGQLITP